MQSNNVNSLLPLGAPAANVLNNLKLNVNRLNRTVNNVVQNTVAQATTGGMTSPLAIFALFLIVALVLLYYFAAEIRQGYEYIARSIRSFMGLEDAPLPPIELPGKDVTRPAIPPQEVTLPERQSTAPLVEKILPPGGASEVFNVSKNTFTYYDAEPLCRALGAELATYDQVKQAWQKGADWCNYGWVKGQTAVYPTQTESWERLQAGPEEQRTACGVPGLNGGYFDNPELRFGVNCYGPKPSQSQHDAAQMNKGMPVTPGQMEIDKKIARFRTEAASLGVMPFNQQKWSE
jgi:hypothetical protein